MADKPRQKRPTSSSEWQRSIVDDRRAAFAKVLAQDTEAGQGWAMPHKAGEPVVWRLRAMLTGDRGIEYPLPLPSELLLEASEPRLAMATKLRKRLFRVGIQPHPEHSDRHTVTDYDLLFRFFEEAMAGILLVYGALSDFANEMIPSGFQMEHAGEMRSRDFLIQNTGLEMRLSRILQRATGLPNLKTENPENWNEICRLKKLREDIEHANGGVSAFAPGSDANEDIFTRLLNEEGFVSFARLVRRIMDLYRTGERGAGNIQIGEYNVRVTSPDPFEASRRNSSDTTLPPPRRDVR